MTDALKGATKTLVIGSTGHLHVTCVDWPDISKVNVVDFHLVIINVRSLTKQRMISIGKLAFDKLRKSLARLLASNGSIVAVGEQAEYVDINNYTQVSNYAWSPVTIGTKSESGDTIDIRVNSFPKYFSHFKAWDYYYFLPNSCLTHELVDVCGQMEHVEYQPLNQEIVVNRYGESLAVRYQFGIKPRRSGNGLTLGPITLLPAIHELAERDAINLVLEDLLELPQKELPPVWAEYIEIPELSKYRAEIERRRNAIRELTAEIEQLDGKVESVQEFLKLLYASGTDLENIFSRCLTECGGKITPAKYSREEFVLEVGQGKFLVECKGVGKSVALGHVRQLMDYMLKYEEDEKEPGKGILFGNAWKDLPPEKRGLRETTNFPDNVIARATANEIALINSVDFFKAFCRFLAGEVTGQSILNRITMSNGIVSFDNLK